MKKFYICPKCKDSVLLTKSNTGRLRCDCGTSFDYAEQTPLPECYLHVTECRSGQTWIEPIKGKMLLDLKTRLKAWVKKEFGDEFKLDGELMPRLEGNYYGRIITDGRTPDSVVSWESGGFYLKSTY